MDETTIKTNLGLILQTVLAEAIEKAGYSAIRDYQYDPTCETPDFLIPDEKKPRYMIEVHQTEARDSFRMKILRAFTAVTESKAFYGDNLISVNVLFGDPQNELPPSNVKALCGIFDVNLFPRKDVSDKTSVIKMEKEALKLAGDEDYKKKTSKAAKEVIAKYSKAIATIAEILKTKLGPAKARAELFPMWKAERDRTSKLGASPGAGSPTFYKRGLLGSLFLSDADFSEIHFHKDADKCTAGVQKQLVAAELATFEELIDGDHYSLDPHFAVLVRDPSAETFRELCRLELKATPDLYWFFEDILDAERRKKMARIFCGLARRGSAVLAKAIVKNLRGDPVGGVEHFRSWVADLMALATGHSQNDFNRRMVQSERDPENYQYPFNHITGRFERLLGCPHHFAIYAAHAVEVFEEICVEDGIGAASIVAAEAWLPDALLKLRLGGAIKLQKFNPLYACLAEVCAAYAVDATPEKAKSIAFDLAGGKGRLGKYDVLLLEHGGKQVMALAVAVHDSHGDDKSKEWGARRLAMLYRFEHGKVRSSGYGEGLFILDGEWEDKDVARLHRCGWTHICRLRDLEDTLKKIFSLKGTVKGAKTKPVLVMEEGDDDHA